MNTHLLSYTDLLAGAALVLINAALSLLLNLGVGRALLIAAARATVQLLLVGLILRYVFDSSSPWLILGVAFIMTMLAGYEVWSRQKTRFAGVWGVGIGAGAAAIAVVLVMFYTVLTIIDVDPGIPRSFSFHLSAYSG